VKQILSSTEATYENNSRSGEYEQNLRLQGCGYRIFNGSPTFPHVKQSDKLKTRISHIRKRRGRMNSNHSPDFLCVFLKSIEGLLAGVQNTVLLKTFPGCGSVDMMVKLISDSCLERKSVCPCQPLQHPYFARVAFLKHGYTPKGEITEGQL
jgi:hypothetical protein